MKKLLCPTLVSFALIASGCGGGQDGPDLTPEEQVAADAAVAFVSDAQSGNWKAVCSGASADYVSGVRNITSVISVIGPKGIQGKPKEKPCVESMKYFVEAQSDMPAGEELPDPTVQAVEIKGKRARVTMDVAEGSFLGGQAGDTAQVILLTREKKSWKFSGKEAQKLDAAESTTGASDALVLPGQ